MGALTKRTEPVSRSVLLGNLQDVENGRACVLTEGWGLQQCEMAA